MTKHPVALAIALALAASVILPGCDRASKLTEQEHIQRAKDFEDKGDLKASVVELKNAIQKNPNSPQARLLLGQIYLKVGMGAEAEKELSQAEKLGVNREAIKPQLGEALLLMGEYKRVLDEIQPGDQTSKANLARILQLRADALLKQGQLKDACNLYQQSHDTDTSNPAAYWGLAQCAIAERDMAKAKGWLDTALEIKDRQAKTWILVGEWEQFNKNNERALAAYSNALKLEPNNLNALQSRAIINMRLGKIEPARLDIEKVRKHYPKSLAANYLQASLKFKENKYLEARDALQEALKIVPTHLPTLMLGGAIENALGNLQIAESHLNKVVRASPRNAHAIGMLASTQLRLGRIDEAEKTLSPINLEKTTDPTIQSIAGEIALAKKEYAKAASHFEKAVETSPDNVAIRTMLGTARLAEGDSRAMSDLQAAAAMESEAGKADTLIILNQLNKKQFDAALVSIAAFEKKAPQSPLSWNYRGAAYLGKKDTAKARESFEQALKRDPKFFPAAENLAQLDLRDGQTAHARKRFEDILKAEPAHLQSMLALAKISQLDKDEKGYLDWLEKAAKAHPRSLPPREGLTRYLLAKGEKNKALAVAQEAVNASPDSPAALNLLGSTQLAIGDRTNAISTYTLLTKKANQSPDAYLRLALAQLADKKTTDARASLETALKLKPDHLPSQDAMLRLELLEKKPDSALQIARQIQMQLPRSPMGFDREADILLAQKRLPEAVKAYEQAIERGAGSAGMIKLFGAQVRSGSAKAAEQRLIDWVKQHPKDQMVRAHLAEYHMAHGRNQEAIAQYLELQRQIPANVVVLNNLATLYQREKDTRALATAEQAYKLAPDNPSVQDTLGWILVEQGQAPRGLELLRKALAKAPKAAGLRYHHAVALARTGKKAEARKALEKLLKDTPNFPEAGSARAFLASL